MASVKHGRLKNEDVVRRQQSVQAFIDKEKGGNKEETYTVMLGTTGRGGQGTHSSKVPALVQGTILSFGAGLPFGAPAYLLWNQEKAQIRRHYDRWNDYKRPETSLWEHQNQNQEEYDLQLTQVTGTDKGEMVSEHKSESEGVKAQKPKQRSGVVGVASGGGSGSVSKGRTAIYLPGEPALITMTDDLTATSTHNSILPTDGVHADVLTASANQQGQEQGSTVLQSSVLAGDGQGGGVLKLEVPAEGGLHEEISLELSLDSAGTGNDSPVASMNRRMQAKLLSSVANSSSSHMLPLNNSLSQSVSQGSISQLHFGPASLSSPRERDLDSFTNKNPAGKFRFRGYYSILVLFYSLFHDKWCIRQLSRPSTITCTTTSIAHDHYTDISTLL